MLHDKGSRVTARQLLPLQILWGAAYSTQFTPWSSCLFMAHWRGSQGGKLQSKHHLVPEDRTVVTWVTKDEEQNFKKSPTQVRGFFLQSFGETLSCENPITFSPTQLFLDITSSFEQHLWKRKHKGWVVNMYEPKKWIAQEKLLGENVQRYFMAYFPPYTHF